MKKLVIILIVLAGLAAAGIYFILPTNINWDKYAQEARAAVREQTGLTLSFQGTPAFVMKPSPMLRIGRVELGNVPNATYPRMMTAERAEIQFDTAALFRRKIKVKKVTLHSPRLYFETLPNGKWNWQTAFFDRAGANSTVGFDSLLLTDGAAEVKTDKYTPVQKWERVNVEMFADSARGPFFLEGNLGALASSFGFSLKVEKFENGRSPDFSLRLINAPAESSFVFNGRYGLTETDRGLLTGNLSFDIRKPDQFFALLYPNESLPSVVFQPVVGNLKLSKNAQTRTAEMTDILFKYGTSSATGKLSARTLSAQEASALQAREDEEDLPDDDDIILRDPANPTQEVRLDDTPARKSRLAENLLPKVVGGSFIFSKFDADPFMDNVGALTDFFAKTGYFSRTRDSYSIDVSFDTFAYKKDAIHQLKTRVETAPDGLRFKEFSATLPADTFVTADATATFLKTPVLSGKMTAETENFGALADWLGLTRAEEIPQNLLRRFTVKTDFTAARGRLSLSQADVTLDKTTFAGAVDWRAGGRKTLDMAGSFSQLNLGEYFPQTSKKYAEKRKDFAALTPTRQVRALFDSLAFLNDADVVADLKTESLLWADFNVEKVKADFAVSRGRMKINEISVKELQTSDIKIKGEAEGFGGEPKFNDFVVIASATRLSSLAQALGIAVPRGISESDEMLSFFAKLTGTPHMMRFDLKSDFGASRFDATGGFRQSAEDVFDWNAAINVWHQNFRSFINLFSNKYRPVLANPGVVALKGNLLKNKDGVRLTDMDVKVGDSAARGSVKVERKAGRPVIALDLTAEYLAPLGLMPRVNFMDAPAVDGQEGEEDVLGKNGVLARFADALTFSKKKFDFSFLGGYNMVVNVKADTFALNAFVLSGMDGIVKLGEDKIGIDLRQSTWNGANFGGMFNFVSSADGTVSMQAAARLSNLWIPAKLFDCFLSDAGEIQKMVVNAKLKGAGSSMNDLFASLIGTGTLEFDRGTLYWIDPTLIASALQRENTNRAEAVADIFQGKTEMKRFAAGFTIKDGTFGLNNASFVNDGEENKTAHFTYDANTRRLTAGLSFPTMDKVRPLAFSVEKKDGSSAVLSENISDLLQDLAAERNKIQEEKRQRLEREHQKAQEEQALQQENWRDELSDTAARVDQALTELEKKTAAMRPFLTKAFQVQKYFTPLNKAAEALKTLSKDIHAAASGDGGKLSQKLVDAFEQKAKDAYFSKEKQLDSDYDTGMKVGVKGAVYDCERQANLMLREAVKLQAEHTDLTAIEQNINDMLAKIEPLKDLQKQAENDALSVAELTVLQVKGEAELERIKAIHKKTLDAVAQKIEQARAAEKAKKEAEEQKKKAEEAAKKAAEEKAAAEKAKQEAAERERQRTIVRTDGVASAASSAKQKTGGSAVLQSLTPEQPTTVPPSAESEKGKKTGSIIIKRR